MAELIEIKITDGSDLSVETNQAIDLYKQIKGEINIGQHTCDYIKVKKELLLQLRNNSENNIGIDIEVLSNNVNGVLKEMQNVDNELAKQQASS